MSTRQDRPNALANLLGELGFVGPQEIVVELRRLNANLEALAPVLPAIEILAEAVKGLDTQNLQSILAALRSVDLSRLADILERYYRRIWG